MRGCIQKKGTSTAPEKDYFPKKGERPETKDLGESCLSDQRLFQAFVPFPTDNVPFRIGIVPVFIAAQSD